jgi:hypothetical protein
MNKEYNVVFDTETNGLPYSMKGTYYSLEHEELFKDCRLL